MKSLFFIISLIFIISCGQTESENIKTSGIHVTYEITETQAGGTVLCEATFRVGSSVGTYVELNAGDRITCNGQLMTKSEFFGITSYKTTLTSNPGSSYNLLFEREGEEDRNSTVILPKRITLTAPVANDTFTKGSPITINLTPESSSELIANIFIDDYSASETLSPEVSSFSLTPLHNHSNESHVAGNRAKNLNLTRSNSGGLASGFDGGSIKAKQKLSVSLNFTD